MNFRLDRHFAPGLETFCYFSCPSWISRLADFQRLITIMYKAPSPQKGQDVINLKVHLAAISFFFTKIGHNRRARCTRAATSFPLARDRKRRREQYRFSLIAALNIPTMNIKCQGRKRVWICFSCSMIRKEKKKS